MPYNLAASATFAFGWHLLPDSWLHDVMWWWSCLRKLVKRMLDWGHKL